MVNVVSTVVGLHVAKCIPAPAEVAVASSNFDRRTRPLIDWQRLAWPAATLALPGY